MALDRAALIEVLAAAADTDHATPDPARSVRAIPAAPDGSGDPNRSLTG